MLSISFILIRLMSTSGIPSTTMSGSELLIEPKPRTFSDAPSEPANPVDWFTTNPGTKPESPEDTLEMERLAIASSIFTADTDPVRLTFFWVP